MSKRAVIVVDIGICEQLGQQLQDHFFYTLKCEEPINAFLMTLCQRARYDSVCQRTPLIFSS